jgi:hypothetical protein
LPPPKQTHAHGHGRHRAQQNFLLCGVRSVVSTLLLTRPLETRAMQKPRTQMSLHHPVLS